MMSVNIDKLQHLIKTLRGENGCPWDRKQTPGSMAVYLIEETYELVDAIESGNAEDICEELGDVLFHILFLTRMFEESGDFDIETVAERITEKMVRRHPHVFGSESVESVDEVKLKWRDIKKREKKPVRRTSLLDSIPPKSPALMRAYRISERAAGAGFDWDDLEGVAGKVEEEWGEFQTEMHLLEKNTSNGGGRSLKNISLEFGDILFTLVNVARFVGIHPETALAGSTHKFEMRFRHMEDAAAMEGRPLDTLSINDMQRLWEKAKQDLDSRG